MEIEQAPEVVQSNEAPLSSEGGDVREQTMSTLLTLMVAPEAEAKAEAGEEVGDAAVDPLAEEQEAPAAQEEAARTEEERKAKNFRGRWDHLNEEERRVVELTTKRGLTLDEAYRAVYGAERPVETKGEAIERPQEELGALDTEIAAQVEAVEALRKKKGKVKGDISEYDKVSDSYLEAREALQALRFKRQQAVEQQTAEAVKVREGALAQAREALQNEYPEALTPGSDLFEACEEEMAWLRESKSPLLSDPEIEYKVARRVARLMGRGARRPEAVVPAIAPKRSVRPVPTGGTAVESPATALERRFAGARSTGAMLELMREVGTPIEALLKKH